MPKPQEALVITEPHNGHPDYQEIDPIYGDRVGGQVAMIRGCLRHKNFIIPVGRRVGKTTSRPFLWLDEAAVTPGIYRAGFFAQDHVKATAMWRHTFEQWGGDAKGSLITESKGDPKSQDRYIRTKPVGHAGKPAVNTGMEIFFWSGSHPHYERVRGATHHFNRISLDEAQLLHPNLLDVVNAMLADAKGSLDVTGTPFLDGMGNHWFEAYYGKGLDPTFSKWGCMNVSSHACVGCTIPDDEALQELIERCRTEEAFLQEIMAQFITDRGAVFSRLDEVLCLKAREDLPEWYYRFKTEIYDRPDVTGVGQGVKAWIHKEPEPRVRYVMGVDWARKRDATVVSVFSLETLEQVFLMTFRNEEYEEQVEWVSRIHETYNNATIYADANGVGDSMTRTLSRRFRDGCIPIIFGADKGSYVRDAQQLFNHVEIKMIDTPAQRTEFKTYLAVKNEDTGRVKFSHPPEGHDDHIDPVLMMADRLRLGTKVAAPAKREEPLWMTPAWFEKQRAKRKKLERMRRGRI